MHGFAYAVRLCVLYTSIIMLTFGSKSQHLNEVHGFTELSKYLYQEIPSPELKCFPDQLVACRSL